MNGPTIHFTTNASDPTTSSPIYTSPILISAVGRTELRAFAVKEGMTDSEIVTAIYEITPSQPEGDAPEVTATFAIIEAKKQTRVSFGGVIVEGEGVSLQWFKNDVAISGATADTYVIPKVNPSHNGIYSIRATNRWGEDSADVARLVVK